MVYNLSTQKARVWDIKNILWFSQDLAMKSLWKGLFGQGLWSEVLRAKYLRKISFYELLDDVEGGKQETY